MVEQILPGVTSSFTAVGFEASRAFFDRAASSFEDRRVLFVHAALCLDPPSDGRTKLFLEEGNGRGNSLHRPELGRFEEVDAIRLSDWIRDSGPDLESTIYLLRMNIEAAEYDVIRDLIRSGLHRSIDGYFGLWDDLKKIDSTQDAEFRRLQREHGISPMTFNGRDLSYPRRLRWIVYDIRTALIRGARRVERAREGVRATAPG
jgi:hypothetical protein